VPDPAVTGRSSSRSAREIELPPDDGETPMEIVSSGHGSRAHKRSAEESVDQGKGG
jgi:hypothetical protein